MFKSPSGGFVAMSLARWLAGAAFLNEGAVPFTKRSYVEDLRRQRVFLQPGDVVIAQGSGLGQIVTQIEDAGRPPRERGLAADPR